MRAGLSRACANIRYASPLYAHQNGAAMIFGLERVRGRGDHRSQLGVHPHLLHDVPLVLQTGRRARHDLAPPPRAAVLEPLPQRPITARRRSHRAAAPHRAPPLPSSPPFVFSAGTSTTGTTPGPFVCMSIALVSPFRSRATAGVGAGSHPARRGRPRSHQAGIRRRGFLMIALPAHCAILKEVVRRLDVDLFLKPLELALHRPEVRAVRGWIGHKVGSDRLKVSGCRQYPSFSESVAHPREDIPSLFPATYGSLSIVPACVGRTPSTLTLRSSPCRW